MGLRALGGAARAARKAATVVARRGLADFPGGGDSNLTPVPPSSRPPATANREATDPVTADPWTAVEDPKTGGTYYWNKLTNETTMVNEPKPLTMYRGQPVQQPPSMGGMGSMIMQSFAVGAGISLAFGLFRVFF